ncbi:MAG TPA: response regulator transcription factor [Flavipsychrobacter sp.]|jgi:DNA-binding NarL/FixJ family response regulator|nr:response regulator transcription factor [Flavipsychrobacter sp.]
MSIEKIRIAMADDHALLRKSLATVINSMEEFEVIISVDNGKLLLEALKTTNMLPQVCILDINMPEMNGYETARELFNSYPEIKIIALSMYDNEQNVIQMIRNGATGYLLKDADPEELRRAILDVVTYGFYQSNLTKGKLLRTVPHEDELSENELNFLKLCCSELSYKEIAEKMFKSPRTIDGYRDSLFSKLDVTSRTGLVLYAIKTGIVPINGK